MSHFLRNMKNFNSILAAILCLAGFSSTYSQTGETYRDFGSAIAAGEAMDTGDAGVLFGTLKANDTISAVFRAKVLDVCQAKGCWMRLELPEGQKVMVRFKDYGFFVPMDIAGSEVVVGGRAFISEVPESERRHLARDAGETDQAVQAISGPVREPGFEAEGVRIFN